MAEIDEGVGNLEALNALMKQVGEDLAKETAGLEADDAALDKLKTDAATAFDDLDETVEKLDEALPDGGEGGGDDALAALASLEEAAAKVVSDDLTPAKTGIDEAQTASDTLLKQAADTVASEFGDLWTSGFDAMDTALDELAAALAQAGTDGAAAQSKLRATLEENAQEGDQAFEAAAQALESLAKRLDGELTSAVNLAKETCATAWSTRLPQSLQDDIAEPRAELPALYESFAEDGDEHVKGLFEAIETGAQGAREVVEELDNAAAGEVDTAVGENGLQGLQTELDATLELLGQGGETAELLEPLVGQLQQALAIVEDVDSLLKAMQGS